MRPVYVTLCAGALTLAACAADTPSRPIEGDSPSPTVTTTTAAPSTSTSSRPTTTTASGSTTTTAGPPADPTAGNYPTAPPRPPVTYPETDPS